MWTVSTLARVLSSHVAAAQLWKPPSPRACCHASASAAPHRTQERVMKGGFRGRKPLLTRGFFFFCFCSGLCSKCCNTLRLIFTQDLFFPWESDIAPFFAPFSQRATALPGDDLLYRWKASHRHTRNKTEKSSKPCLCLDSIVSVCFRPRHKSSFRDKL